MNINITPSAVAVDTAANLLAFLEMAKDPSKLKAVLAQIKAAQAAAAAEADSARAARDEAAQTAAAAQDAAAKAAQDLSRAREEAAKAAQSTADADVVRAAVKSERQKFDDWMAQQREALSADSARVAADADLTQRRAAELDARALEVAEAASEAQRAQAAADALRADYERKVAALKSIV